MLIVIVVALAALTILTWRADRERLSGRIRAALLALRLSAILLLLLLATGCDPLVALRRPPQPRVIFLVDNSLSMGLRDGTNGTRWQTAVSAAQRLAGRSGINGSLTTLVPGSADRDSLRQPARSTDLAAGIERAARDRPDAIVLLSDGDHNRGRSPVLAAAGAGLPVFTVGTGPASAAGAAAISDIAFPDHVGSGEPFTVSVSLNGVDGPAEIVISEQGRAIARRPLAPGATAAELGVAVSGQGLHRCRVQLLGNGGILDQRVFPVMADKSRIRVAWIGTGLDWNLRFFAQALAADPAITLRVFMRRDGEWINDGNGRGAAAPIDSAANCDLAVICTTDPAQQDEQLLGLVQSLTARGGGLLMIGDAGPVLVPWLPLRPASRPEPLAGPVLLADGWRRSSLFPGNDTAIAATLRHGPVCSIASRYTLADSEVIALASIRGATQGPVPCWAWKYAGSSRVMQFASPDLWKWKLALAGAFRDTVWFDQMISNTVHWLAGAQQGGFTLEPERGVSLDNEPVTFRAQWQGWDEKTTSLHWGVAIAGPGGFHRTLTLTDWGHGRYAADAGAIPAGQYTYQGHATLDGRTLDRQRGILFVEPGIDETRDRTQNRGLLREIAAVSGGAYIDADSLDPGRPWPDAWPRSVRAQRGGGSLPLLAVLAILLLSGEWLLRRRYGLR